MWTKGLLLAIGMMSMVASGASRVVPELVNMSAIMESKAPLVPSKNTAFTTVIPSYSATARTTDDDNSKKFAAMVHNVVRQHTTQQRVIQVKPGHRRSKSDQVLRFSPVSEKEEALAQRIINEQTVDAETIRTCCYELVSANNCDAFSEVWGALQDKDGENKSGVSALDLYGKDKTDYLVHCAIKSKACQKDPAAKMLRFLIETVKVPLNVQDRQKRMPLHCAVVEGCIPMVKLLIEQIKDIGDPQQIRALLDARDGFGYTPLHVAVLGTHNNHHDIVRRLVEAGAWVDARDAKKNTPLHLAANKQDFVIVSYLIWTANAAVKVYNSSDELPYDLALRGEGDMDPKILKKLNVSEGCCVIQ